MRTIDPKELTVRQLEKRVFLWGEESDLDKKYFRERIQAYLFEESDQNFWDLLWNMAWIRNEKGKTIKYMHFNEHRQKVGLDKYFYEWGKRMCNEMQEAIESINHKANKNEKDQSDIPG